MLLEHAKKEWLRYLELYGADVSRWPITLCEEQMRDMMALPEYAMARDVDMGLDSVEWPTPLGDLRHRILEDIQGGQDATCFSSAMMTPSILPSINSSHLWASCFVLFLCMGLMVGIYLNDVEHTNYASYGYFALDYAYSTTMGGTYAQ